MRRPRSRPLRAASSSRPCGAWGRQQWRREQLRGRAAVYVERMKGGKTAPLAQPKQLLHKHANACKVLKQQARTLHAP